MSREIYNFLKKFFAIPYPEKDRLRETLRHLYRQSVGRCPYLLPLDKSIVHYATAYVNSIHKVFTIIYCVGIVEDTKAY